MQRYHQQTIYRRARQMMLRRHCHQPLLSSLPPSLSSFAQRTIDQVLSITVLCDIIFGMMLQPREIISVITMVCDE
jgi:hypothetical protein